MKNTKYESCKHQKHESIVEEETNIIFRKGKYDWI